ncbi:Unknown protein sequence [Pseudomonas coronafaciens pv. oryzae]|nr:Unknown protein sequence [Pseudomonas coronafaciens pv. oryzae]
MGALSSDTTAPIDVKPAKQAIPAAASLIKEAFVIYADDN